MKNLSEETQSLWVGARDMTGQEIANTADYEAFGDGLFPVGVLTRRRDGNPQQGRLFDPSQVVDRTTVQRQSFDDAVQRDDVWFHSSRNMPKEFQANRGVHLGTLEAAIDRAANTWLDNQPGKIRAVQTNPVGRPIWPDAGDNDQPHLEFESVKGPTPYYNDAEDPGSISVVARNKDMNVIGDVPVGPAHETGVQPSMFLNEGPSRMLNYPGPNDMPGWEEDYPKLHPRTQFTPGTDETRAEDRLDYSLQRNQFRRIGGTDYPVSRDKWVNLLNIDEEPSRGSFPRRGEIG